MVMGEDDLAQLGGRRDVKGKHKENAPSVSATKEDRQNTLVDEGIRPAGESMASRFANSATALANNLLPGPCGSDNVGPLLPMNKAESSDTSLRPSKGEASSYRLQSTPNAAGRKFKSVQVQDYAEREEAAFSAFLDGTNVLSLPESSFAEQNSNRAGANPSVNNPQVSESIDYSDADGIEVVKLLDYVYDEVAQPEIEVPLTAEEATALKRALFGKGADAKRFERHTTEWGDLLNFIPEYILNDGYGRDQREISQHLGTSSVTEGRKIWARHWEDVLSSYTDEVWGDLSSLVTEARAEIRTLQSDSPHEASPPEVKAIRRLRQILAHVRAE
ncbi:hypothetical protein BJ170DRAFT_597501 [Xylariales sp. AK1849]|nr:hypothetical protein BJ170DRAFT_597501 [Xylariales sp. AK1849]